MRQGRSALIARVEFPLLLAGLVAAACLWGFVEMVEVARSGAPHAFDTDILLALRVPGHLDTPIGPHWLQGAMRDITSLGSTSILTLVTASVVVYFLVRRQPRTALFMLVAVVGGQVLGTLLKLGIERPRPELVSHLMNEHSYSFPSGHAMMSAVTFLTLGSLAARALKDRAARIYVICLAVAATLLVGVSRIYLGVHWPSDVLGGWCAGFAWALACWLGARLMQRRKQVEEDA
ncbi:phosphatase PAP2 family protein [Mesorhizobium sp. PUT5]|uniref:phosphatase PAP2 family protein n=1 Tax=Mesorhizobium sp. PUT5 TaxID=3454629 RepID=UPI003FA484D0